MVLGKVRKYLRVALGRNVMFVAYKNSFYILTVTPASSPPERYDKVPVHRKTCSKPKCISPMRCRQRRGSGGCWLNGHK